MKKNLTTYTLSGLKMLTVSLKEFALTGRFGPVHIGMTAGEVVSLLGEPGKNDLGDSLDYVYGWYEFFFDKHDGNKLTAIQNDNLFHARVPDIFYQNDRFRIDTWFLEKRKNITRAEVVGLLQAEAVPFSIRQTVLGYDILAFESGVTLDFTEAEDCLNAIRYFPFYNL